MEISPIAPDFPYMQLAAQLRAAIEAGEITGLLPSLTTLTAETGLSTGTVQRAIRLLKDEGLVYTMPGRGTFTTAVRK